MTYEVFCRWSCNGPQGCMAVFEGTPGEAREAGWALGRREEDGDYCGPCAIAVIEPGPALLEPEPPLEALPETDLLATVTDLVPRPEFIFVPPGVEDMPADDEDSVLAHLPGTDRLIGDLTAPEPDEGETRGEGWLASNLRRWSRMAGRHAAPDRRAARDRSPVNAGW